MVIGGGLQADHPLQAGPLRVQGEEARVARQAVHRASIAMPRAGAGVGERFGGRAASGAGTAFAGFFREGVRRVR